MPSIWPWASRTELPQVPVVGPTEALLRQRLAASRGVSIVVGGKVYTAGRSRGNHLVEPVWVAMLTPSEGGGS